MNKEKKATFAQTHIIILLTAIITGLLLSFIISLVSKDFIWRFFEIALFNSIFLGLSMLLSAYFTSNFIFRMKNAVIMAVSFFIVLWAGVMSSLVILVFEWEIFFYYSNGIISYLLINVLLILSLNVITTGFRIYQGTVLAKEKMLNEEKYLKKEMELKLLASKLNPHFLFNSLNLIISLLKRPGKAENALINLSDLLRDNLDLADMDSILIKNELEGVRKYLDLQKMRFERRLEYEIDCEINMEIPPFLIQPLIENSINHNINHTDVLKIYIGVSRREDRLVIRIIDSCKKVSPDMLGKGTGLPTTKKRVENSGGEFLITDGGIEISFDYDKSHNSG